MIGAIFAQHAPLLRDYPGAPPTPPAPPAPPQSPQPPVAEPIAFNAVTRASLFGIIGSAISSTTLATITCADAAMPIMQSEVVAGLTFSYSAGVLSVAGTPTGSTRVQRVVVSYIASDGSNSVRGSTSHEITLVNASEVLTIGSQAGTAGRVGHPLSATLANPSANYNVNVTAHPAGLIPGCTAALDWTPGATSSGTLTLAGTPTRAGALPLVVNYRSGAIQIGASVHSVVIAPAYEALPAAPAPTPAPAPPAPSAPPAPTPTPAPGMGPDPLLASVKVLMHFDAATGLAYDHMGNPVTNIGVASTTGAVNEAGLFAGAEVGAPTFMAVEVAGCDGLDEALTAECMADISAATWATLTAAGDDTRFCPVLTYCTAAGEIVWSLGVISQILRIGYVSVRETRAAFYAPLSEASGNRESIYPIGRVLIESPARLVHLCGMLKESPGVGFDALGAVWFDGAPAIGSAAYLQSRRRADLLGARLQIGGAVSGVPSLSLGPPATIVPFGGAIDEVRITTASRYADNLTLNPVYRIAPAERVIPWPNY